MWQNLEAKNKYFPKGTNILLATSIGMKKFFTNILLATSEEYPPCSYYSNLHNYFTSAVFLLTFNKNFRIFLLQAGAGTVLKHSLKKRSS
jgi:hypothetical protein